MANDSQNLLIFCSLQWLCLQAQPDRLKFFVVNNHLTDGVSFSLESCWSRSAITAISSKYTEGVVTFNYDVTVSNGVNLMPYMAVPLLIHSRKGVGS